MDEKILLGDDSFRLSIMPRLGGKIASIRMWGGELLQTPLLPLALRTRTVGFSASDGSGWDECFPSVAACTVETKAGAVTVPDHGDLWRVEWEVVCSDAQSCTLRGRCFSLPLVMERTATANRIENGWRLELAYAVSNAGNFAAPWMWAAHPLFATEKGDRILLPGSIHELRIEVSGGERLGKAGATVDWPVAKLAHGNTAELSVAQAPDSGSGDKLFAGPLTAEENWAVLERPSAGVRIRVGFDPAATPYLGLWLCYGAWPPNQRGPKQVCAALEPSTAPTDSLARRGAWSRELAPDQKVRWRMTAEFERFG